MAKKTPILVTAFLVGLLAIFSSPKLFSQLQDHAICSGYPIFMRPVMECILNLIDKAVYFMQKDLFLYTCDNLLGEDFYKFPRNVSEGKTQDEVRTMDMSMEEIRYYNLFAAAVYCTRSVTNLGIGCCFCSEINEGLTYHTILENADSHARVLVAVYAGRKEAVIAFRGTTTLIQAIHDFDYTFWGYNDKEFYHGGFSTLTLSIIPEVRAVMESIWKEHPGIIFTLTGHSLGAAMASFFLYYIQLDFEIDTLPDFPALTLSHFKLVTFGQPRTGSQEYADVMNNLTIKDARVVNAADIVPQYVRVGILPRNNVTEFPQHYYVHHGREVWTFDDNSRPPKRCRVDVYEDWNCQDSLDAFQLSVRDHLYYLDIDYSVCMMENLGQTFLENFPDFVLYPLAETQPGLISPFQG